MLSNVAMHDPCSWVVSLECDDDVAGIRKKHDVTTGRGVKIRLEVDGPVVVVILLQDGKVVAMKMNLKTSKPKP